MVKDLTVSPKRPDADWHFPHGEDIVRIVAPQPGQHILDLGCGSGLIAIPSAQAAGPLGTVTGVDITASILAKTREKAVQAGVDNIVFLEADIGELDEVLLSAKAGGDQGQQEQRDKHLDVYDAIVCTACIPLVDDPAAAIASWAKYLKPHSQGRLIVDVSVPGFQVYDSILASVAPDFGSSVAFDRDWIQDVDSLPALYRAAGLRVTDIYKIGGYRIPGEYRVEDGPKIFDRVADVGYYGTLGQMQGAREEFLKRWAQTVEERGVDGVIREEVAIWVVVGGRAKRAQHTLMGGVCYKAKIEGRVHINYVLYVGEVNLSYPFY